MSAVIAAVRHLWTADEYLKAAQAGVFAPGLRTELIDGEIIEMRAQSGGHIRTTMKTDFRLRALFADVAHVRVQMTLRLGPRRVPEPDLLVVRGTVDDAAIAPASEDILLVAEVSDGTLAFDRSEKARLYARAGVSEYWIINLRNRQVEVHRSPDSAGAGYIDVRTFVEGEAIRPLLAPPDSAPVPVADLLPTANEAART